MTDYSTRRAILRYKNQRQMIADAYESGEWGMKVKMNYARKVRLLSPKIRNEIVREYARSDNFDPGNIDQWVAYEVEGGRRFIAAKLNGDWPINLFEEIVVNPEMAEEYGLRRKVVSP